MTRRVVTLLAWGTVVALTAWLVGAIDVAWVPR
jgi:hypothetical protein